MVRIERSRSKSSSKSGILRLFLTSILCSLSFYCGSISGSKNSGVACPDVSTSTFDKGAVVKENAKIEAIVQQRVEAGECLFLKDFCIRVRVDGRLFVKNVLNNTH